MSLVADSWHPSSTVVGEIFLGVEEAIRDQTNGSAHLAAHHPFCSPGTCSTVIGWRVAHLYIVHGPGDSVPTASAENCSSDSPAVPLVLNLDIGIRPLLCIWSFGARCEQLLVLRRLCRQPPSHDPAKSAVLPTQSRPRH
jgi:hypothetical protein